MDLIEQLLNPNCPLQQIRIPDGQVNGVMNVDSDYEDCEDGNSSADESNQYAEEYQKREEEMYAQSSMLQEQSKPGTFSMVEGYDDMLSSVGRAEAANLNLESTLSIFTKYNFDTLKAQELTIDCYKDNILTLVKTNEVVVIQGPTGCGKTTQVPQFILDDCRANGRPCKIVVTQPRRIAAISVARRVCEERGWGLGSVCGYQVGLESNLSNETLIHYVTTGVLLQKLIGQKTLTDYTHILIDEVHERNQDIDFLMIIVRRFLNTNSSGTKLILMSATFDTEQFAEYFKCYVGTNIIPAPVIYVSKDNKYNTQTFYAEQLQTIGKIPDYNLLEPKIDTCLYELFVTLVRAFDQLDVEDPSSNSRKIGNVLVFLPGIFEIEEAHDYLTSSSLKFQGKKIDWQILPLHSSITIEEQRRIFQPPASGNRKIILSTNIAESSITVPDVVYVVDFCLTKTMIMDAATQYQSLQLQWASHVNCTQRAGRVGRCSDGRVYRLVTRKFYETCMSKTVLPEMLRAPLTQVVLASKLLDLEEPPKAILALAMDPPHLAHIDSTILLLKEVGGLSLTHTNKKMVSDGDITFIGRIMASLPLDVYYSKLIVLGYMFSCLEECIIMATGCTLNIFKSPFKERLKAYTNRLQWADGSCSDLIAYLNLYKVWQRHIRMGSDSRQERTWAEKNFVSQRTLREWNILVKEVKDRLDKMQIRPSEGARRVQLSPFELPSVIKVVICGAFYPNYFTRSCDGGQIDEREAVKTLGGRDPCNSVYFTGFDPQQPGPLYTKRVKQLLVDCATSMQVSFDNSSKIYVQFANQNEVQHVRVDDQEFVTGMPGKIRVEVYRAVRLRQLSMMKCSYSFGHASIPILEKDAAWRLAKELLDIDRTAPGLGRTLKQQKSVDASSRSSISSEYSIDEEVEKETLPPMTHPPVLPAIDVQYISLLICERIDAGHFWAHNNESDTEITLRMLDRVLNTSKLQPANPSSVVVGSLYTTVFHEDKRYYRCKVLSLNPYGGKLSIMAQVVFIDYGNTATVQIENLFMLPKHEIMSRPPQAMECYLSQIQPSIVANPRALWSSRANSIFDSKTADLVLYGKVYSVVNGIVHLELYLRPNNSKYEDSLNYWLIQQGYAQEADESFLSKENHQKRLLCWDNPDKAPAFTEIEDDYPSDLCDVEPPKAKDCRGSMVLKGPFSPLEMRVYSVLASGMNKSSSIEANSVNTVLLDSDPQDPHERLVVAAYIGQNPNNNALSLRHTTVMPNLHGFSMLMSLLFCPLMEPKPTADGTRIGAILCGLGAYDNSHKAVYGPHDICLTLDTDLTEDDINKINELRYWMNSAINAMECAFRLSLAQSDMESCQIELKSRLFGMLKCKRTSVERTPLKHANVWGKALYDADTLQPGIVDSLFPSEIWPLHWTIKLARDKENTNMTKHLNELEEFALKMKTANEIICQICNITLYSAGQMRLHLTSKAHRDKIV